MPPAALASSVTTITTVTTVTTAVIGASQSTQLLNMGPTFFIFVHQQQLLRAIVLIGSQPNEYVVSLLRTGFNPLTFIILPPSLFPDFIFSKYMIKMLPSNKNFKLSGFETQTTFFKLCFLSLQFIVVELAFLSMCTLAKIIQYGVCNKKLKLFFK